MLGAKILIFQKRWEKIIKLFLFLYKIKAFIWNLNIILDCAMMQVLSKKLW